MNIEMAAPEEISINESMEEVFPFAVPDSKKPTSLKEESSETLVYDHTSSL